MDQILEEKKDAEEQRDKAIRGRGRVRLMRLGLELGLGFREIVKTRDTMSKLGRARVAGEERY